MVSLGRVLIIVQNLPVPFDRRVWLEATTLTEHGYTVSVICPKGKHGDFQETYQRLENVNIFRYPVPFEARNVVGYLFEFGYCFFATFLLSLVVLVRFGFDVLHICNPPETYFLLSYFYKIFGKKVIFDHHDLSPEMYVAKGGKKGGILYHVLLFMEKKTFQFSDIVLATNESHRQVAITRGKVRPEKVFIVRSGPDMGRLHIFPPDPRLKFGRKYLICYLGEMCSQDGVDILVHIIWHLVNCIKRQDSTFVLIGGGPESKYISQLIHQLNLDDFVVMTGRVPDSDLCRYLSSADVCVDPTPYTEWSNLSTMNKVVEYMFFGKPIVSFDLIETRVSAADAALYVQPNDIEGFAKAVDKLLNEDALRLKMGAFGRERVEKYLSWDHSAKELVKAYEIVFSRLNDDKRKGDYMVGE